MMVAKLKADTATEASQQAPPWTGVAMRLRYEA